MDWPQCTASPTMAVRSLSPAVPDPFSPRSAATARGAWRLSGRTVADPYSFFAGRHSSRSRWALVPPKPKALTAARRARPVSRSAQGSGRVKIRNNLVCTYYQDHFLGPEIHCTDPVTSAVPVYYLACGSQCICRGKEHVRGQLFSSALQFIRSSRSKLPMIQNCFSRFFKEGVDPQIPYRMRACYSYCIAVRSHFNHV